MESFPVAVPPPDPLPPPQSANGTEAEYDALRIQAAAVAAQQAAVTEEELRLRQRAAALERQEQQLAAHLEEQQARLLELREQVKQDRAALKDERAALREQEGRDRDEAVRQRNLARKERHRFVELRKRLKRRWHRHWREKEAELRQLDDHHAAERQRLGELAESLRCEREELQRRQLRFNGESEVGRRQLREEWDDLQLSQQRWEEALNHEQAERDRRTRTLADAERTLAEDKRHWQQRREALAREVEGLETRLRNQRHRLTDQEHRLAQVEAALRARPQEPALSLPPGRPAAVAAPAPLMAAPVFLGRLAGDLTDQRRHLLEQWQRLLQVEQRWQQDRNVVVAELERAARQVERREELVVQHEQALAELEAELRQRQEALARSRHELEAAHARLLVRQTEGETERAALLSDVRAREAMAAGRLQRLENLRQRRSQRRRVELAEVRAARTQCEQLRQQYLTLVGECQQRRAALAQEQRALASQAVAMERFRLTYLSRLSNTATAEKRLERLRRKGAARLQAAERELTAERAALQAEAARLEERAVALRQQETVLAARQEEWSHLEAGREDHHLATRDAEEHYRQVVAGWQTRYEHAGQQLAALREEIEHLARLLLDEVEPGTADQAA
jgi:hypothetical protein